LKNTGRQAVIIGGGITGLSAALELANLNIDVTLIEQADRLGGIAVQLSCKATDRCVACGACIVSQKLHSMVNHPNISVCLESRIKKVIKHDRYVVEFEQKPLNAITQVDAGAIIAATGFQSFDPESKPYGYKRFKNVITNLELERMLRKEGRARRPSDGNPPQSIAFIQCVGSRDAQLNHLWCSRVCCASALRIANRIKWDRPDTDISIFYIDIQEDLNTFKMDIQHPTSMHRIIPGDIIETDDKQLQVACYENGGEDKRFDMVVLSIGMMPRPDNYSLYKQLGLRLSENAFSFTYDDAGFPLHEGIFPAGAVTAPMGIAESIASAGKAARDAAAYLMEGR
jgi:heterodisulfide reductase subunit A